MIGSGRAAVWGLRRSEAAVSQKAMRVIGK